MGDIIMHVKKSTLKTKWTVVICKMNEKILKR